MNERRGTQVAKPPSTSTFRLLYTPTPRSCLSTLVTTGATASLQPRATKISWNWPSDTQLKEHTHRYREANGVQTHDIRGDIEASGLARSPSATGF
jgi:hypothetical protein